MKIYLHKIYSMPCNHKFLDSTQLNNLLPIWKCKTLIIGTFNPENDFHPKNSANFFYQRKRNYFWDVLPQICGKNAIDKEDTISQIKFLKNQKIGITDLLLSIEDADHSNNCHIRLLSGVKDDDIENFSVLKWNTGNIIDFIEKDSIEAVFFTKLGNIDRVKIHENTFEFQMRKVENYCIKNNVYTSRLHTPTGMGLGRGSRIESLSARWVNKIGSKINLFK